ncbi:ribonuclease P protein component [Clostridium acetireducens DSM 10703]|jgi:ribonuclease P protein component|uniref:Ribonuclease P protein component n=1 Tax=Clostridium acetireducens DSM 10703 TaxID=1121290 RepID=A0A1E8EX76_9CLOT|nr:ribonuclease P protein component [Clostridium acetireducens]OFI05399.1 ribonuclease P protein component [Clostridium acetireducens DSM 10703]
MKFEKLKKNSHFRIVYKRGKSFSNRFLVLYIFRNKKDYNRLGISVSKKVGKSVIRNRVKRLIKESYRLNNSDLKKGYDLVFIARNFVKNKNYNEVLSAMVDLFKKAGLYDK